MTKPKCKACHNKTYYASYNGEEADARSKRKSQCDNETVQRSQTGREEEPHKAKLFQEESLRKKNVATLHTLLTNKPQANNTIDMG